LLFFPAGLFFEKPRKIIFAGKANAADGRMQRANPGGFLSFLFGSFSFTERKRTKEKREKEEPQPRRARQAMRRARTAISSAAMLTAISSGVSAPMSSRWGNGCGRRRRR